MSYFNLSSTDPEHYNRIEVKVPNTFTASQVQVCVSTLTTNCNFQVLNEDDYITFQSGSDSYKVMLQPASKIDVASLPYILQEAIDKQKLDVQVSLTNLDTLRFTSKKKFAIMDVSYNAKLLTGLYCTLLPAIAEEYEDEEPAELHTDKAITSITFNDMNIRINDIRPVKFTTTPPDAYGYTIQYKTADEKIATVDTAGHITGIAKGNVKITANVRNPGKSQLAAPDFVITFSVEVMEPQPYVNITKVTLPEVLELYEGQSKQLFPEIEPTYASGYEEYWESADKEIATCGNGYIMAGKIGETTVSYIIKNNLEETTQTITHDITVYTKSATQKVTKNRIEVNSVGYTLSTPVLYLLTNLGVPSWRNEMNDKLKIQCGTIAMILNNSFSSSFPIIAEQSAIVTTAPIGLATDFWLYLVDANYREVKLLNPMYVTIQMAVQTNVIETPGLINPDEKKPTE